MNKKVILFVFVAIFFYTGYSPVFAVKAYPFPVNITQPDGTQLTIRLQGDEFHHFQTTEDGYILKKDAKGYLTYASVNATGKMIESSFIARNINKRTAEEIQFLKSAPKSTTIQAVQTTLQKSKMSANQSLAQRAFPKTGSQKSLVILVNFADNSFTTPTPQTSFKNLLNQNGYSANGGTGSARDYFMACSYGKFRPAFDVVGPYTLPNTMAYYGANDADGNDAKPDYMIADACKAANNAGLDFSQYDTDNDGIVDNVFVYYAGYNEAEGASSNTIWPHRWDLESSGYTGNRTFNGKTVDDYACTSELKGTSGSNMCGIGTFCHEFGHVLGLPDYYDTNDASKSTLNYWDIMDEGCYNNSGRTPPVYSVYDRFFLGYLTPEQVSTTSNLNLFPIYQDTIQPANTTSQSFLLSEATHNLSGTSPDPKEFFMLEYRKKTGWDTFLPAEGLLIWHIDYNQTAWNNNEPNNYTGTLQTANSHMRVYLQPLNGSSTTPGAAFTSGSFTPTTWSGVNINREISEITKTDNSITFKLMVPKIRTTGSFTQFSTTVGTPSIIQSLILTGSNLNDVLNISLSDNTLFDIKLSTDSAWSKSINISPISGSISTTVQVRYNPTAGGTQTDRLIFTSTGATEVDLTLNGTCTVPNVPTIIAGRVENTIRFPTTKLNTTCTKALNIKTTDIVSDLTVAISGTNSEIFSVSVSSITKDASNAFDGINITITYNPVTAGDHSAILTISGGGLNPDKIINLYGSGF
jgi:M6 family metalloprotease-like protein